jgi:hypothetical protein
MNSGKTVFAQLMDFLPTYEFHQCVGRKKSNAPTRSKQLSRSLTPSTSRQGTSLPMPFSPERAIADYLVGRKAHYHFTVKKNQPTLHQDIKLFFKDRGEPDFVAHDPPDHGRIEVRKIWATIELDGYLDFHRLGQAFMIERHARDKKERQGVSAAQGGGKSPTASPAGGRRKPMPSACSRSTAATGASRAVTT